VEAGEVLLDWDYSKGQPTMPLLKNVFASERRKVKSLNFNVAVDKSTHGLAQDLGISHEEAQKEIDAWYADRPEVKDWQEETRKFCKKQGFVRTIMGRYCKSCCKVHTTVCCLKTIVTY
jgi:DNA polymerase-1